jgi:RNA polymerase sigma-70 factor (ECF subfamily)
MADPEPITTALLESQRRLFAYILAFVGTRSDADDVLQETNAVLLRKHQDFQIGTDFWLWASKVAYFEVLTWRKRRRRDQAAPLFDDATCAVMADEAFHAFADLDARLVALRTCLEALAPSHRDLIRYRYTEDLTADAISTKVGRTPLAVRQVLFRLRAALAACVARHPEVGRPA